MIRLHDGDGQSAWMTALTSSVHNRGSELECRSAPAAMRASSLWARPPPSVSSRTVAMTARPNHREWWLASPGSKKPPVISSETAHGQYPRRRDPPQPARRPLATERVVVPPDRGTVPLGGQDLPRQRVPTHARCWSFARSGAPSSWPGSAPLCVVVGVGASTFGLGRHPPFNVERILYSDGYITGVVPEEPTLRGPRSIQVITNEAPAPGRVAGASARGMRPASHQDHRRRQ